MFLFFFFVINYFCFVSVLLLFTYGFKEQSYKLAKYLLAFFLGMLAMELIL
ncbi:MAG: hypothetical protein ABID38_00490 [Candidatus Diapherotrites archaeon]